VDEHSGRENTDETKNRYDATTLENIKAFFTDHLKNNSIDVGGN